MNQTSRGLLGLIALTAPLASISVAVDFNWNTGLTSNWNDTDGWTHNMLVPGVPGAGDTASLTNGATTLNANYAVAAFNLVGGSLNGSNELFATTATIYAGSFYGGTLRVGGGATQAGATVYWEGDATLINQGAFTVQNGTSWEMDATAAAGAGRFLNAGTLTFAGAGDSNLYNGSGQAELVNSGVISVEHTNASAQVYAKLENQVGGLVQVSSTSNLYLRGGSTLAAGSTLQSDGATLFAGGTHTLNGGTFTGAGYAYALGGVTDIAGTVGAASGLATGGFGFYGGSVVGNGTLNVDHAWVYSGNFSGGTVRATGDSYSTAGSTFYWDSGATLRNEGTFTINSNTSWEMDATAVAGGGRFENAGTLRFAGNGDSNLYNGSGQGVISNTGTMSVEHANSAAQIYARVENEAGGTISVASNSVAALRGGGSMADGSTIDAQGTLYFYGGTHDLQGGTITGSGSTYGVAGVVNIAGTVGAVSGPATGGFGIHGSTVVGTGTLSVDHVSLFSGTFAGGTIRATGASSTVPGSTLYWDSNGTLRNEGTFNVASNTSWEMDASAAPGGGRFENSGTLQFTGAGDSNLYNGSGQAVITNTGTVSVEHLSSSAQVYARLENQSGGSVYVSPLSNLFLRGGGSFETGSTLNVEGSLYFYGGTAELSGGTITGNGFAYATSGVVNLAGSVGAASGPATGGYGFYVGTTAGSGSLNVDHAWFYGGTFGGGTVRATGTSYSSAGNTMYWDSGATFRNEGTLTLNPNTSWEMDASASSGGGRIENAGTLEFVGIGDTNLYNSSGQAVIANTGTISANSSNSSAQVYARVENQSGGTIEVSPISNFLLRGGASFEAGSTVNVNGSLYLYGGVADLSGGTITGDGYVYATAGLVNLTGTVGAASGPATGGYGFHVGTTAGTGSVNVDHAWFYGGTFAGGTVRGTGASYSSQGGMMYWDGGATFRNDGTLTLNGGTSWEMDASAAAGGGRLENAGTLEIAGNSDINVYNGNGEAVISNSGTIHVNQTAATNLRATFESLPGSSLLIESGAFRIYGNSVQQGSVRIGASGSLYLSPSYSHAFSGASATISGTGVVYGSAFTLSNGAHVAPGASPGTLTIASNAVVDGTGGLVSFDMELNGVGSGEFDTVLVSGALLDLGFDDAQLNVLLGFAPSLGDTFRILDTNAGGTIVGSFMNAPTTGSVLTSGLYSFEITYGPSNAYVDLTVTAIPEPAAVAGVLSLVAGAFAWRRRSRKA